MSGLKGNKRHHEVFVIEGVTSEDAFLKQARKRLDDREGFTMVHHHRHAESCTDRCYLFDPRPDHQYRYWTGEVKFTDQQARSDQTCQLYKQLELTFKPENAEFSSGQHCAFCHCTCLDKSCGHDRCEGCES